MSDEIIELKRQALIERRDRRDSQNKSILETMGLEQDINSEIESNRTDDREITLECKPSICTTCKGYGKIKPMFYWFECSDCHGTGYNLLDPISIIKWQKLCMSWSKEQINLLRHQLVMTTTTEEQRLERSIMNSYEGAEYNRND